MNYLFGDDSNWGELEIIPIMFIYFIILAIILKMLNLTEIYWIEFLGIITLTTLITFIVVWIIRTINIVYETKKNLNEFKQESHYNCTVKINDLYEELMDEMKKYKKKSK